ncbi:MAG TPA: DUF6569 family protein [Terriglobales bacterium]|nr:DUF6569 family protein [Terriglobales bacterium]
MKHLTRILGVSLASILWSGMLAGSTKETSAYKVLDPIESGSLTVFPVVAAQTHDTSGFMTLDDGLRSGDVVVTEAGNAEGLVRGPRPVIRHDGAQVNTLVLINRSDKPLILLAGEIVTGGKQDRIIGKDRIVPAHSDPIDLSVFCVEPGRWVERSAKFGAMNTQMAQPSIRASAMAAKNQQQVWDGVRSANRGLSETVTAEASPSEAQSMEATVAGTTSYAKVMASPVAREQVDKVAAPIEGRYHDVMHQLHDRHAVGVVVAVNGRLIWSDVFASTELLEKYWPKLVRSYAAETFGTAEKHQTPDLAAAQEFLDRLSGEHEVVESEPGVYREAEITGVNYTAFELTSLIPKTDFDIHIAKMAQGTIAQLKPVKIFPRQYGFGGTPPYIR